MSHDGNERRGAQFWGENTMKLMTEAIIMKHSSTKLEDNCKVYFIGNGKYNYGYISAKERMII
jgi:hypothetical protein